MGKQVFSPQGVRAPVFILRQRTSGAKATVQVVRLIAALEALRHPKNRRPPHLAEPSDAGQVSSGS